MNRLDPLMVTLRDVTADDLEPLFEHQRDPEAARMAAVPGRAREAFMAHWHERVLGDPEVCKRTVVVGDEVAGHIGAWTQAGERLVGYWIGRRYWGRGVATAALSAFLRLETTRPLHARVAAHNIGSIRVLEKCGFRRVDAPPVAGADGVVELQYRLDGSATGSEAPC